MTANHNELLSALVDGELRGDELDMALDLIHTNDAARKQWQNFQRTSDILHGHRLSAENIDLTPLISQQINDEADYSVTKEKAKVITFPQQLWKQAASLAVAASIGALAVMGVMNKPESSLMPAAQVAEVDQVAAPVTVAQNSKRWTVGEQDVAKRLDTYLVDHNESTGPSGVFSYARVVSYDEGQ